MSQSTNYWVGKLLKKLRVGEKVEYLVLWQNLISEFFQLKQSQFVSAEELVNFPAKEQIENFLKVKQFISEDSFIFNQRKRFYCIVKKTSQGGKS